MNACRVCPQLQDQGRWRVAGRDVRENKRNPMTKELQAPDITKSKSSGYYTSSIIQRPDDFHKGPLLNHIRGRYWTEDNKDHEHEIELSQEESATSSKKEIKDMYCIFLLIYSKFLRIYVHVFRYSFSFL